MPLIASQPALVVPAEVTSAAERADKINLALRRTADKLLLASGDSVSRIPAVEKINDHTWRITLDHPFEYKRLPPILQASLDIYGIRQSYEVTVRQCETSVIDLGYHQQDFVRDSMVPCGTREAPPGCHYIEVMFSGESRSHSSGWLAGGFLLAAAAGLLGLLRLSRRRINKPDPSPDDAAEWLSFGKSRIHISSPVLESGGHRIELTYREAKLLRLFATQPGKLLERDRILSQVWEDEGVQVGRSVDVFVSRLRKKLVHDPTVAIVAVHGVGYKLETEVRKA
jgi:hypothetical protein